MRDHGWTLIHHAVVEASRIVVARILAINDLAAEVCPKILKRRCLCHARHSCEMAEATLSSDKWRRLGRMPSLASSSTASSCPERERDSALLRRAYQ